MRSRFDEQLELLNNELIEMGAMCEEIIALASKALTEGNAKLREKVDSLEDEINRKERSIEGVCLKLLLQQQPVARDLRQISAALKMITDMERIGDQAYDISEIAAFMNGCRGTGCAEIRQMAIAAVKMVTDSVEAYVRRDVSLAREVIDYDDVVDDCFYKMKKLLIDEISAGTTDGEYALDLLMIAKYFERIGDHATNIAEWVLFSVTGVHGGTSQ